MLNNIIKENLDRIEERISNACFKSGRSRDSVTLIAVSKTKPVDTIMGAYEYGIRLFGENRVQEMLDKETEMPEDINWHLIGHLQRNKAKQVIGKTCMIHSVESVELASNLSKYSLESNIVTDILVEVNIAGEASKYGVAPEDLSRFIRQINSYNGIRIRGLMTVAPFTEYQEDNRKYFRKMRQLSVDIKAENIDNVYMDFLSMGMTGDFETAIEEGATHIRIGTGIFGDR